MASNKRVAPPVAAELQREYQFVREIGRGGTAVVYLATDRELGRPVAIKLIQGSLLSDEDTLLRFSREARTAAVLHHPNIVAVHAVKRLRNGTLAMVLQYVPGGTLKDLIRREAPLPIPVVERVVLDIAAALAYAHRNGIVHRDVKPENIFLDAATGCALLADFGIARTGEPTGLQTMSGVAIGTPAYMSPEQIDGGEIDGRADLYSLALVAWEMLTGDTPWEGESLFSIVYKQKYEELPALETYRDDVPLHLWHAIATCLRKDREHRFRDVDAFVAAMEEGSSANPVRRWKRWLAARRLRVAAPPPAPPPPPAVRLSPAERFALPDPGAATDATVRFRRPSEEQLRPPLNAAPEPEAERAPEEPEPITVPLDGTREATGAEFAAPPEPRSAFPFAAPVGRTARALRYAAAAGGLLLITGVGATLYALAQQGPAGELQASSAAAEAGPPTAPGDLRAQGLRDAAALLGGGALPDFWPTATSGVDSLIRPTDPTQRTELALSAAPDEQGEPTQPPPDSAPAAAADAAPPAREAAATTPTETAGRARSIVAGGMHTCVLTASGEALCWGGNGEGQTGNVGPSRAPSAPAIGGGMRFRDLAAGVAHTCGILTSGETVCWGSNQSGQLGDGSTASRSAPARVAGSAGFRTVYAARSHSCGLTQQGQLFCWGDNADGQLGTGNTEPSGTPVRTAAGPFTQAALGWSHTCALDRRGTALCWGANGDGQLGNEGVDDSAAPVPVAGTTRFSQLVAGATHTCALTSNGNAFCWGRNAAGQLGNGTNATQRAPTRVAGDFSFASLSAGSTHTCGLTRGGEAFCWGRNSFGQLGDGSTADRNLPVRVDAPVRFASIQASGAHSCGLTSDGEQFCWGYNVEGQLGDGTRAHRSRPVRVTPAAR